MTGGGDDRAYYLERAEMARQRAAAASDEDIARIHTEMAQQYEMLASDVADEPVTAMIAGSPHGSSGSADHWRSVANITPRSQH